VLDIISIFALKYLPKKLAVFHKSELFYTSLSNILKHKSSTKCDHRVHELLRETATRSKSTAITSANTGELSWTG